MIDIYDILCRDFAGSADPIAPAGVRSQGLLESAVYRQFTGFEARHKYPDPCHNAASLTFGICCDHPFLNGNKRTALVALLVHLDANSMWLTGVSQDELYNLMLSVAAHSVGLRIDPRKPHKAPARRSADDEVDALSRWIRSRAANIDNREKIVTFRILRQLLLHHGIEMEENGANQQMLVRYVERPASFLRKAQRVREKIGQIGYHDEGTELSRNQLKKIREMCGLTEQHGVDSSGFYQRGAVVGTFVNSYRRVLRQLAKT